MADEKRPTTHDTLNAPSEAAHRAAFAPAEAGPAPSVPPTPDPRWGVEGCCVRQFWAVVERDGTLVRGRNVVSCRRAQGAPAGTYEVYFTAEVSNGVYTATIGRPGIATEPPGMITVALRCCPGFGPYPPFDDNKGVWVQTFDSAGNLADRAFHLLVHTQ